MSSEFKKHFLPSWRFLLPLSFQTLLIIAVPAQDAYTYYAGKTVALQTVPVDPYDLLRGYSQTLSYDISRISDLKNLPGWQEFKGSIDILNGTRLYVILEKPPISTATLKQPQVWGAVAVSRDRPNNLPDNQIALEGIVKYNSIEYGLERYYLPENKISQINREIGQLQRDSQSQRRFVVEVKIDGQGNSVPVSLWLGENKYRF
ncbi:MAG: GDYXXLXY domain-containing protein [Xenococcaceae cyanobacterium]